MRRKLESLDKLGKFKIKIVERAGNKLVDVLHKSNAWSELDCERNDCIICSIKDSKKGSCRRRNVLYETFCITCEKERKENISDPGESMLNRENKPKNPVVVIPNGNSSLEVISNSSFQKVQMGGAKDANDTPVFVEAEARPNREVVQIQEGNSSQANNQNDSQSTTCPGIYEKGACPP